MAGGGGFILEYANKRNLKAMLRHVIGRNGWSPYAREAVEFVELNFNFHPASMRAQTHAAGFDLRGQIPVSWFRLGILKRAMPIGLLAALDALVSKTGLAYSPSVFMDLRRVGDTALAAEESDDPLAFLRCPRTGSRLRKNGDALVSENGLRWRINDGVYDFRAPVD